VVLEHILQTFYDVFECMGGRLDAAFIQQTVDMFLAIFTPTQISALAAPDGSGAWRARVA
jgi:hypothetical protein